MSNVSLEKYDMTRHGDLSDYQLQDETFTSHPKDAISDCLSDVSRVPVAILNEERRVVGYFTLHFQGGPETYGYLSDERVLIRALSIDDRFRRKGYALTAMSQIFDFIEKELRITINYALLAVNVANRSAQDMYEKLSFKRLREDFPGTFGKLIIMEKSRNTTSTENSVKD